MSKVNELVEMVSFLSGKPTRATAQVQVDADTSIDLSTSPSSGGSADATSEAPVGTAEGKDA